MLLDFVHILSDWCLTELPSSGVRFFIRFGRVKAGNLYDGYDTVTSTEGFYAGVSNTNLKFVPPSKDPPKIQDNVRKEMFRSLSRLLAVEVELFSLERTSVRWRRHPVPLNKRLR